LLHLTVVGLLVCSIKILMAGSAFAHQIPHKLRRTGVCNGVCGVAVVAKRRLQRWIVPVGDIGVNGRFKLLENFRVAAPACLGNVPAVYTGSRIINGKDGMMPMAIFAGSSHDRGSGFSRIPGVNAFQVESHKHFSVIHAFQPVGVCQMAGGADPDFFQGTYFRLRRHFVASVTIPAVGGRRFRSLAHLGVTASGYIFRFFLVAALALRLGQTGRMRESFHALMTTNAGRLAMDTPGDLISVDVEACGIFPRRQSGLRCHDH
jgi:hypothetical protein